MTVTLKLQLADGKPGTSPATARGLNGSNGANTSAAR